MYNFQEPRTLNPRNDHIPQVEEVVASKKNLIFLQLRKCGKEKGMQVAKLRASSMQSLYNFALVLLKLATKTPPQCDHLLPLHSIIAFSCFFC